MGSVYEAALPLSYWQVNIMWQVSLANLQEANRKALLTLAKKQSKS